MSKPYQNMASTRVWQRRYGTLAPKTGDLAPGFEMRDVDGKNPVPLSDFRGRKPVILDFGRLSGFGAHTRCGIYAPQTIKEHGRVAYASGPGPFGFKSTELRQEEE